MKATRILGFCVIVTLLIAGNFLQADTSKASASGTVELDGKTYTITTVQAKTVENSLDDKKDVMILLTDQPVSEMFFDRWSLIQGKAGKLHGILAYIDEDQNVGSMYIYPDVHITGGHVCEFEPQNFSYQTIAGRLYQKDLKAHWSHKYRFDIQFQTPVKDIVLPIVNKETGTALPYGGGEVGTAYLEFDKHLRLGNFDNLKKLVIREEAGQFDDPKTLEIFMEYNGEWIVKTKISEGYISTDRATLFVDGIDPFSGKKATGIIRMRKINNVWLVEKQTWEESSEPSDWE